MKTIQIIAGLLLLSILFIVGCNSPTGHAIVDESLICVPTETVGDLEINNNGIIELNPNDDVEDEVEEIGEEVENTVEEVEPEVIELDEVDRSSLPRKEFSEGELVVLDVKVTDPDGDPLELTYSDPLDNDGEWQTSKGDSGEYVITITASDGKDESVTQVLLVIEEVNTAPEVDVSNVLEGKEGELFTITPVVSDNEGEDTTVSFSAPFDENGEWQTDYADEGTYQIKVTATDGTNTVTETVTVKVENINREPVLDVDDAITVIEGDMAEITGSVSDPDNDNLMIVYGSPFDEEGKWQTSVGDAGVYIIDVTVSDAENEVSEIVTVKVNPSNTAPSLSVEDVTVIEGDVVNVNVEVSDPDGDDVTVVFEEPLDSTGTWTTDYNDEGVYEITVTATDGIETVTEVVTVTVEEKNRAPVFQI
jgi:hypothetical protein